ncbi:MAG: hypothetical protein WEB89_01840 [Balneolales bacterium]
MMTQNMKPNKLLPMVCGVLFLTGCGNSVQNEEEVPIGKGLAWQYPGDEGIEKDPEVVFAENFEAGDLEDLEGKWGFMSNSDDKVMLFSDDIPAGSAGMRSLQMTATRGENEGGELYKTFEQGWDKIYLRFYTKFAEDHGNYHHFVALRGFDDPLPYPMGGAGDRPENHFSVTIEPSIHEINTPETIRHSPPGIWSFYAYWPEMHSWQSIEGEPDGRPNPYYGNRFQPTEPAVVPRGEWVAIEVMLKLNSSAEKSDGEVALWIDGDPVIHFKPGTPEGYMTSDRFRIDPDGPDAEPFEGFRWRHDMNVKTNVLRLQHYVSDSAFSKTQEFADDNPDYLINTKQATVWFDDVVMAKEYIGTMRKASGTGGGN